MTKKTLIVGLYMALASLSHAGENHQNAKKEKQFSELRQQMIQTRKDRVDVVNKSIDCLKSAKDNKGLDLCAQEEMKAIRLAIDGFCQLGKEDVSSTPDFKLFCIGMNIRPE